MFQGGAGDGEGEKRAQKKRGGKVKRTEIKKKEGWGGMKEVEGKRR